LTSVLPLSRRAENRRTFRLVRLLAACLMGAAGCATEPMVGAPLRSPVQPGAAPLFGEVRTIVLDAGHGGHDPGTSHHGLKEKYVVLDIARRLRARLQAAGLAVAMTRDTDRFLPLSGRPAVANRMRADLFVSVHANANRNRRVSGIEVYYPRTSVVSSSVQWPPSITAAEVGIPSTTVKQVLWDLVLRETRLQSRRLGSAVCRAMERELQAPCRVVKPARFVVLREAWMPAVLVEVGYVSNYAEAQRLGSAAYRDAAAAAIAAGILAYIRERGAQHI